MSISFMLVYQTGYSAVSCCALTFTVVNVHPSNAYDDESMHLCIYHSLCL